MENKRGVRLRDKSDEDSVGEAGGLWRLFSGVVEGEVVDGRSEGVKMGEFKGDKLL